jgi:hypothetical protein
VVMDLRGFSAENLGCIFEIHELVTRIDLARVVFVVDARTDERLLLQVFVSGTTRQALPPAFSPNPRIFRLRQLSRSALRKLLSALAAAATTNVRREPGVS